MIDGLDAPMTGDGCRAELFGEQWREPLKAACAEDPDIWPIYSISFDPEHFDQSIDLFSNARRNRTFVLFDGDELAGMSSFLGIDEDRGVPGNWRHLLSPAPARHRLQPPGQGHDACAAPSIAASGGSSSASTSATSAARRR